MQNRLILIAIVLLAAPIPAPAEIRLVPDEYPTIKAAINACVDRDEVVIAPGVYTGPGNHDIDFLGKAIAVRSTDPNDPEIVAATIIDCNDQDGGFYFHSGEWQNSVLNGLTLTRGRRGIDCWWSSPTIRNCVIKDCHYGAIHLEHSSPVITECTISRNDYRAIAFGGFGNPNVSNCIFTNNYSPSSGGAIHSYTEMIGWQDIEITGCTFIGNSAEQGGGAIAQCWGRIANCVFIDNAAGHNGGALAYWRGPITNCIFSNNYSAQSGGAIRYHEEMGPVPTDITGCTFIGNVADNDGGAILCDADSPTITNCDISENSAGQSGGGICCLSQDRPAITNCTINSNVAYGTGGWLEAVDGGGGVYGGGPITNCTITGNESKDNGGGLLACSGPITNCTITGNKADREGGGLSRCNYVINCIIAGNSAGSDGGGISIGYYDSVIWGDDYALHKGSAAYEQSTYVEPTVTNCTISQNSAASNGGGVFCYGSIHPMVSNCILWANTDSTDTAQSAQIGGETPYVTFSCIQDDDSSDATIPFGGEANHNIDDDPMLTPDKHLEHISPCINAGDPYFYSKPNTVDIDSEPRVVGGRIDMGADEYSPMITVTKPAGGEVWTGRSVHEIRWQSYGVNGQVRISYSTDGGRKWKKIKNKTDNTGTFRWRLPRKRKLNSDQCLVSVVPRRSDPDVVCKPSGLFTIHQDTPGPAVRSRWSSLGGDFDRTGLSEDAGPDLGCVKWQFETQGPVSTTVTIGAHDNVHIACEDGKLYTLDPDGSLLWSCDTNSPLYSAPTVGPDGSVYVGGENGRLYAINTDGQVRWTHSTGAFIYSSPAVSAHGEVYVGSADGILYALGPDGSELWRFDDGGSDTPAGPIFASPAIGPDGTVYISRLHDANLYALDPTDGHIKWSCSFEHWIYYLHDPVDSISGWPFASPVVAPDGTIYQTLLYDPNLYAIDPNTGTILWSLDLYGPPCDDWWNPLCYERDTVDGWSEPVLGPDGTIYVSFNDANLRAVDPNGTIKWQTKLGSGDGFTLTVADNGLIYAAGNDGWLCAIDPNGTEIARFQGRAGLNFPVVSANNTLIVSDNANMVWAIGGDECQGQQQVLHRPEDPDGSGIVNLQDVALLMLDWSSCTNPDQQWWQPPCDYHGELTYLIADVDRDMSVDFRDLRMITSRWLTVDKSAFLGAQP